LVMGARCAPEPGSMVWWYVEFMVGGDELQL
jgi:hypothetical protein